MARLLRIRIAGWKSIRDIDPKLELGSLNVLIGANGSGKSNFVSFFRLLHEMVDERLQTYLGQSGGADSVLHFGSKITTRIDADLEFETEIGPIRYAFVLTHAAPDALWINGENLFLDVPESRTISISAGGHRESQLRQQADQCDPIAKIVSDLLRRSRIFHFHDTSETAKIRQSCYIEANQALYSDGGNLAAMLYLYQQTKPMIYRRIVSMVRKIMPMFDDFVLEPQRLNPRYILFRWKQRGSDYIFGPHQVSDGSLRAMALIALFLQPREDLPAAMILDEPELGLHPDAIEFITGLIRSASLKTQVILTTQSTTFLDHFDPKEIVVVNVRHGDSILSRLDTEELRGWLRRYRVSELWEKNVLGGGPFSVGPLGGGSHS
jgi:predicted ATPase